MHNLVAMFANVAQNASLTNLSPVTDPLITIQNSRFIFPFDVQIGCLLANVVDGSRCRINTPSYRSVALPEVYPVKVTAGNGTNPPIQGPMWDTLRIPRNDEFGLDVSRAGAGAADCFAGIWYAQGRTPAPSGPVITLRATVTMTLVVGNWVTGNLTFDQSLPYGKYAITGMSCQCTSAMFGRLAFPGGTQYRPGVPAVEVYGSYINPQAFRMGNFGLFGVFDSTAQPLIEIMGYAAGAQSAVILLDLIKIG